MHSLLNRRELFGNFSTGLAGLALAVLNDSRPVLANERGPIRPEIDPSQPHAPRKPHHAPRAKNVLMIFCSGAISHIDTWDYKPELIKRHDTPMPGSDKLITFQGENGNLIKSPWAFRPRGQCGKMISDLLPNLAELADEIRWREPNELLLVCAGTFETFALEDAIGAGELAALFPAAELSDAARVCVASARAFPSPLEGLLAARNGRALSGRGWRSQVEWCAQLSRFDTVGAMTGGVIRAL